jgi:alkylhydroperoxidase/carboxymuconolactone decarboxylase family protein YurZ
MVQKFQAFYEQTQNMIGNYAKENPELMTAFSKVHHLGSKDGALKSKFKDLIALGISINTQCEGCITMHIHDAIEKVIIKKHLIGRILKGRVLSLLLFSILFFSSYAVFAHCDTMDGPVIADAHKALEHNNVNYVLKWVHVENEAEIKEAFNLVMKVRRISPEAKDLSDKYFYDILVRIHRAGEGVPFNGVKLSGTPIDKKILAADKSIELGNLSPLKNLVPKANVPELTKRFEKVMALKNFDVNNVADGREYIEAYVQFFHFAEGEEEGQIQEHKEPSGHLDHLPWILSGIFLITTLLFGVLLFRKH